MKHNHVLTEEPNVRIGEGTIYSAGVSIVFRGRSVIADNDFTALALDGATLELHDDAEFVKNRGFRGGAVAMYGHSRIAFMKNSALLFKDNSCVDKGGAIYIQSPGSPQVSYNVTGKDPKICFFTYEDTESDFDDWNTQITFQDNHAPKDSSGHSVFATTLQRCRTVGETRVKNSVLHWKFIKYITTFGVVNATDNHTRSEIATEPVNIIYEANEWNVSPSQVFNPTVTLLDENNNSVPGVVNVLVENSSAVRLHTPSSLFLADGHVSRLRLGGEVGRKFSVALQHVGRQVLQKKIHITSGLKQCNPGFHLRNGTCVCQDQMEAVSRCDKNGKTVFLKVGYWAGMVNDKFTTYPCPPTFCNCPKSEEPSTARDECVYIGDKMCAGNRDHRSILCGKCKPGFSVVTGDQSCFECQKYGYLVWIPIWLAVIFALVMLAMALDIDAFTGSLNACLYSYQVSAKAQIL